MLNNVNRCFLISRAGPRENMFTTVMYTNSQMGFKLSLKSHFLSLSHDNWNVCLFLEINELLEHADMQSQCKIMFK